MQIECMEVASFQNQPSASLHLSLLSRCLEAIVVFQRRKLADNLKLQSDLNDVKKTLFLNWDLEHTAH